MILNLFIIAVITVFIIDISGFVNEVKLMISKWLTKGKIISADWDLKPFTCSLCMTFWIGLIYIICLNQFTLLNLLLVCVFSFLTPVINETLLLIKDLIIKLINKIRDLCRI